MTMPKAFASHFLVSTWNALGCAALMHGAVLWGDLPSFSASLLLRSSVSSNSFCAELFVHLLVIARFIRGTASRVSCRKSNAAEGGWSIVSGNQITARCTRPVADHWLLVARCMLHGCDSGQVWKQRIATSAFNAAKQLPGES